MRPSNSYSMILARAMRAQPHAWTGGNGPRKLMQCLPPERALRTLWFREQTAEWADGPPPDLATCRILYRRAAHDAHSTMRAHPEIADAFAHHVHYQDAMLRAWMRRTGRGNSYMPADVPPYIERIENEARGKAEAVLFITDPLAYGQSYTAYLRAEQPGDCRNGFSAPYGVISTWAGDKLAIVTRIRSRPERRGFTTDGRGSFWAVGIDGRWYYGTHNGRGMYCRMRLAKNQPR